MTLTKTLFHKKSPQRRDSKGTNLPPPVNRIDVRIAPENQAVKGCRSQATKEIAVEIRLSLKSSKHTRLQRGGCSDSTNR